MGMEESDYEPHDAPVIVGTDKPGLADSFPAPVEPAHASEDAGPTTALRIQGMPFQRGFVFTDADGEEYEITDAPEGVAVPDELVERIVLSAARGGLAVVVVKPVPADSAV